MFRFAAIADFYIAHATMSETHRYHEDVTKWKHFPRYWSFVWGIHR